MVAFIHNFNLFCMLQKKDDTINILVFNVIQKVFGVKDKQSAVCYKTIAIICRMCRDNKYLKFKYLIAICIVIISAEMVKEYTEQNDLWLVNHKLYF